MTRSEADDEFPAVSTTIFIHGGPPTDWVQAPRHRRTELLERRRRTPTKRPAWRSMPIETLCYCLDIVGIGRPWYPEEAIDPRAARFWECVANIETLFNNLRFIMANPQLYSDKERRARADEIGIFAGSLRAFLTLLQQSDWFPADTDQPACPWFFALMLEDHPASVVMPRRCFLSKDEKEQEELAGSAARSQFREVYDYLVSLLRKADKEASGIRYDRIDKGYAAFAAFHLLEEFGACRPTLTAAGPYFELASALYEAAAGRSENIERQCRSYFHIARIQADGTCDS
ncbi:MAG: hypothetical protein WAV27_20260 [Xanthobacteraceae bacterium]